MSQNVLIDITQIPARFGGLEALVRGMAVGMLALIVPLTLLDMNAKASGEGGKGAYSGFVIRVSAVIVGLLAYKKLYYLLLKGSQMMSFAILSEYEWGNFLAKSFSSDGTASSRFAILFNTVTSLQEIILFLTTLVALTARDVIVMLQGCFLSLLFVFGPIAIVCSINNRSAEVTRNWIVNSIQVAFWSFFLRLIVRVWLTLQPVAANMGQRAMDDYLGMLTVNVCFLLLVLGTPIVTARLLSGGNLSMFAVGASYIVQSAGLLKTVGAGQFVSREIVNARQAMKDGQATFFKHPITAAAVSARSTMTRGYERLFGRFHSAGRMGGKDGGS